jgi:hypothetical protein
MANTLTNLIPTMYEALDIVSRKRKGYIPAVFRDSNSERAALNQSIRVPIVPANTSEADNTAAVTPPDTGDQVIGSVEITISKSKHIPIRWTGEETRGLLNAGTYNTVQRDRIVQAIERLDNLIETDLATSYKYASRAYGTAGTTPFGTTSVLTDFAKTLQILEDNGAPANELKLVVNNPAMANLRGIHSELFKANEAGTDEMLRDGKLARLMGFDLHQSGFVPLHTKGTASSATLTSTDYAVGSTTLTLASAGTGTIVEGDVVNIAGENNGIWYGVRSGDADVSDAGTFTLNDPGLTIAQTTNTSAVTVPAANWRANLAFHKNAIVLLTRAPAMPEGGDMADDAVQIADPLTGLVYEFANYRQFHQNSLHVRIAWGWQAIKQEHIAILLG